MIEQIMLLKNLGLAGGFLMVVGHGAGHLSIDAARKRPQAAQSP
jgi:uncharacterized membrane protein YphA (DoxX/SURF4 family)